MTVRGKTASPSPSLTAWTTTMGPSMAVAGAMSMTRGSGAKASFISWNWCGSLTTVPRIVSASSCSVTRPNVRR